MDLAAIPPTARAVRISVSRFDEDTKAPASWMCLIDPVDKNLSQALGIRSSARAAFDAALDNHRRILTGAPQEHRTKESPAEQDPDISDMLG